jgi:hypothetical protein
MAQDDRHIEIAECMAQLIRVSHADPYMRAEVSTKDLIDDNPPSFGITVSPETQQIGPGTNERDDITYSLLVIRSLNTSASDDHAKRIRFLNELRTLFHRKRLTCISGCHMYCTVDSTQVAIPNEWKKNNNSILIVRVNAMVRESRERE